MKRKIISLPPRLEEMVNELKNEKGYPTDASVFHAGVIELHSRAFPNYMRKPALTGVDRLKASRDMKEARAEDAETGFIALLDHLGGKVVVEAGKKFAVYFNYTGKKRFEQKVPLEMLSSDLVKTQYQPSRAKVEKLQQEGKCDYEA